MHYIISGGLGFIGRNLTRALSMRHNPFMVLDRLSNSDLCDPNLVIPYCTTFVHLAAITDVRKSITDPEYTITQNTLSTIRGLEAARNTGARFVFMSSMGAPNALSPYSASKLACEAYCKAYRESYNVNVTILRLSNVYGPHSTHKTSVVAKFIKSCIAGEDLKIYGDGLQTRDFIHVRDVVDAITDNKGRQTIKVASGQTHSIIKVAELIRSISADLTGFKPEIIFTEPIRGEIMEVKPETDISPNIQLKHGLEETFKWYLSQ